LYFFGGLECVGQGHSFAFVAHFVFLRDIWIRTKRAAAASMQARHPLSHSSPCKLPVSLYPFALHFGQLADYSQNFTREKNNLCLRESEE
jgi:hypothetical protein